MRSTAIRKERERSAREELILDHAQRLLMRDGFQNLNLDELAEAVEYSKGTLYLHFETKEDLALAIATRGVKNRADLFERASRFKGRTRERIRAIGFACVQFALGNPDYYGLETVLKSASFWEKASAERQRQHGAQASRIFYVMNQIIFEAVSAGDLPPGTKPEWVTASLIAVTMGSQCVGSQKDLQTLCAISDPIAFLRTSQDVLLDGWGWKPLLKEWDYAAVDRRIKKEIFPEANWIQ